MEQTSFELPDVSFQDPVSELSHRLRTPLTAIKSFSEILLRYRVEDAEVRNLFVRIIDAEADRLAEAIDELLEGAAPGASGIAVSLSPQGHSAAPVS